MNKSVIGAVIAIVAVGGVVALATMNNKDEPTPPATQTQTQTETHTDTDQHQDGSTDNHSSETAQTSNVTIQNFAYSPSNITVKVGTTVTWTNQDSDSHDITPDTESDDFMPSELLAKGQSYSFTFAKAGTYSYHCSPHPYMKATVTVTE